MITEEIKTTIKRNQEENESKNSTTSILKGNIERK
jgi:hypothetical protein